MKTTKRFLFASAVALGFTLTANARAITAPPRWQQVLNERNAPVSMAPSPQLVSGVYLGSAARFQQPRPQVVPGVTTPNLVGGNYPGAAAKNPYYRPSQVESVPFVKMAGGTCERDCCAKK